MKILYEFKCNDCNSVFEELTEFKRESTCECGGKADKILSAPRISLEGVTGDFPGAAMSWDKKHAEKLKQEQKKANS